MSIATPIISEVPAANLHGVKRERYLPQIDALRAIAAFGVLLFHLYTTVYLHAEIRPSMIVSDLRMHPGFWRWAAVPCVLGYAGVPLFFVISGFCIQHSYLRARRGFSYLLFMGRRFWRIYPAYVVAIALSLILPGNLIWRSHHVPKSVLMHLLFIHNFNKTTIFELSPPFWTLAVEFQFYAAFPLLLMLRRWVGIHRAVLISLLVCLGLSVVSHLGWLGALGLPLTPVKYWVQWCLGALIAERFYDGRPPLLNLPMAICVCLAGIFFAVPIDVYGEWNYLAWAVLFAAVIERWIRRNPPGVSHLSRRAFGLLVWLGSISYSIYLLHVMILFQILPRLHGPMGSRFGVAVAAVIPVVIAASAVSYYLIELPGIVVGRQVLRRFARLIGAEGDSMRTMQRA